MRVTLRDLCKHFGKVHAVDSLSLEIGDADFVALLGPSGCGKTTTLLMIAGIYKPTRGHVQFDEQVVNELPPKDRNIGMVFQSYALYPHMTVFDNLTFPLMLKKTSQEEMAQRAQRVADMMDIGHLMDRKPAQLSGGQQQRVALGRALVKEPDLLLFDEPLSNLDARLRLTMRAEIKRLQMNLGITSIYVTHDQVEAMTMADRIAVMKDGILQAYSTPEELYDQPKTLFVANFIGNPPMSFIDAELVREGDEYRVRASGMDLSVPAERGQRALEGSTSRRVVMGIRPEDITLADDGQVGGEIYVVEPLGRDDLLDCRFDGNSVHVLVDPALHMCIGDHIRLAFNMNKVQFFDPGTERSLLWG